MQKINWYSIFFILIVIGIALFSFTSTILFADNKSNHIDREMDDIIRNDPDLDGALAGISIRSAASGEIVYEHMGDVRLRPASNMKLLTAAAAFSVLGEAFTFTTEIRVDGQVKNGVVNGNLYLVGKGDPTLRKTDLNRLANELTKLGIKKIDGDIIGDDTWYDDIRYAPDMIWSDEDTYFGAQTSALTISPNKDYDAGTVMVTVQPGNKIGVNPTVTLIPDNDYITIINEAETVEASVDKELEFSRIHGTNTVKITGDISKDSKGQTEWVSVWEPTEYALSIFTDSLRQHGIEWTGTEKVGSAVNTKTKELVTRTSMPLSELVVPYMKLSNNGHAETLIKEMGKQQEGEGTWSKGLEVLKQQLNKFGLHTDQMVLRDGSGVSHISLIPANEISTLLYVIQDEEWFPAFLNGLPVSGTNARMVSGTLRYRMDNLPQDVKVYAKTGTLTTVSSLSGYVETSSGETLIFSILLNNLLDDSKGKNIEDKIVSLLASL